MLETDFKRRIYDLETEVSELKGLVNSLITENVKLREENVFLKQENKELKTEVKNLKNQLLLNSKNSNKPPSSDVFVKQTKTLRKTSKKKSGGQQGHNGTTLNMVECPDFVEIHEVKKCIYCETNLLNSKAFDI